MTSAPGCRNTAVRWYSEGCSDEWPPEHCSTGTLVLASFISFLSEVHGLDICCTAISFYHWVLCWFVSWDTVARVSTKYFGVRLPFLLRNLQPKWDVEPDAWGTGMFLTGGQQLQVASEAPAEWIKSTQVSSECCYDSGLLCPEKFILDFACTSFLLRIFQIQRHLQILEVFSIFYPQREESIFCL